MQTAFGQAAADYVTHRAGFPQRFYARLGALGIGFPGQRILDVGTGPGTVALELAARGAQVVGLDPDRQLLEAARTRAAERGLDVAWREGTAEATGLPDAAFDVVVAAQCWHWFDRPAAAKELLRVLRPGGSVVIAHHDWLELPGSAVELSVALAGAFGARYPSQLLIGRSGLYPDWLGDLDAAGVRELQTFSFDAPARYTHEAWRGRLRASALVLSMSREKRAKYDAVLAQFLAENHPDPMDVPHRVFVVHGTKEELS